MRKTLDMVTSALLIMGLGYIVAVAARSLPGGDGDEPLLSVDLAVPDFASAAFRWLMLAIAGFGAVLLLMSLAKTVPGQRFNARRYLTILVWLAVLLFLYRVARPATEGASTTTEALVNEPNESITSADPLGTGWMVGALIVAVVAATITRLAFVAHSRFLASPPEDGMEVEPGAAPVMLVEPLRRVEGRDPRSRVVNAYAGFEQAAKASGVGRVASETPRHHAQRTGSTLDINGADLAILGGKYESVRFAEAEVEVEDAVMAETAWERLRRRMNP